MQENGKEKCRFSYILFYHLQLAYLTEEDKKHYIHFDEISERILKNVPNQNKKYVKKQLELLDRNFLDYVCYYNEKYYRNGFCDGVQLIVGCVNS